MSSYVDRSSSYFFCNAFRVFPWKNFKFDNKDTELNPVIEANISHFLTFPTAWISLIITTILFSYLANRSDNPLGPSWRIFPSVEQSMFPWGCSGRSHSGSRSPFCLERGLGMLMWYHQPDEALMCGPGPGYGVDKGKRHARQRSKWARCHVWYRFLFMEISVKSYVHSCPG